MRSFFFLYVGIDCYKMYSLELLLLDPISFSMLYLHFICFKIFFDFLFDFFLDSLLFRSVLFEFHIFKKFPVFLFFKLLSSFILFGPGKMLGMISILLNLLKLALWSTVWSILENVICVLRRMFLLLLLDVLYSIYVCQVYLLYRSS